MSARSFFRYWLFSVTLCACGDSDGGASAKSMYGEYGLAEFPCYVELDGKEEWVDSLERVRIEELVEAQAPALTEGCEAIVTLEFETCPDGCGPTKCQACLLNSAETATAVDGELGSFFRDGAGCAANHPRGGASEDLFFSGMSVAGTFHFDRETQGVEIELSSNGGASYGVLSTRQPATLSCSVKAFYDPERTQNL